jgi:hypothetical protein
MRLSDWRGNRSSDAIARSLNICNFFDIPHGAHAPAVIFAALKQSMKRRRGVDCWRLIQ